MCNRWTRNLGITIQFPNFSGTFRPVVDNPSGTVTLSWRTPTEFQVTVNEFLIDSLGKHWRIIGKIHTVSEYEGEGHNQYDQQNSHHYELTLRELDPEFRVTRGRIKRGRLKGSMFVSAIYGVLVFIKWANGEIPFTRLPRSYDPLSDEEEKAIDTAFISTVLRDKEAGRYMKRGTETVAMHLIGQRLRDGSLSPILATDYLQVLLPGDQLAILGFLEENKHK